MSEEKKPILNSKYKSFTVTVFSIFGLVIAALNVLVIHQTGVEATPETYSRWMLGHCCDSCYHSIIWEMNMLLTTKKSQAKDVCRNNLLIWDSDYNSGRYKQKDLAKTVDTCYMFVALAASLELIFQVVATLFGVVISVRYYKKSRDIKAAPETAVA
ncbi:hypothetical protein BGZ76_004969 [Entomortierella beljakovae]|nr:hypothetical protein BGZ76_004969 [Entomortierella beljakovae]